MWFLSAVKIPPQSPVRWWFFCYWAAPWWWCNELPIDVYGGSGAPFFKWWSFFLAQRNWWFYPQIRSDAAPVKERPEKKRRNAHESAKPLPDVILTSVKVLWSIPEFFWDPKKTGWGWESVLLVNRALAGHTKLGLGSWYHENLRGLDPPQRPSRQLVVIVRESTPQTALRLVVVWKILSFLPRTSGKWSTLTNTQLGLFSLNRQNQFTCPHVKEVAITCFEKNAYSAEMPPYFATKSRLLRYDPEFAHVYDILGGCFK